MVFGISQVLAFLAWDSSPTYTGSARDNSRHPAADCNTARDQLWRMVAR
jgi:hypothetical protein